MRKVLVLFTLCPFFLLGQLDDNSTWKGTIQGNTNIYVEIFNSDSAFIHLPTLGMKNLEPSKFELFPDSLNLNFNLGQKINISGRYYNDRINCTWQQSGVNLPFTLNKTKYWVANPVRPQEPKPPYSYLSEEIKVKNTEEDFMLSGTLTAPDTTYLDKVVILISGSGPQNRDSEIMGHKPFLVLSDYLSNRGISVLRYDDRGVAESGGSRHKATSWDFKNDLTYLIKYLQQKGYKQIGVAGHSEGGMIAQLLFEDEPIVDFVISLAGPGSNTQEILIHQNRLSIEQLGFTASEVEAYLEFQRKAYNLIDIATPKDSLYEPLKTLCFEFYNSQPKGIQQLLGISEDQFYFKLASQYFIPWFRYFINYKPEEYIKKINTPTLVLNGSLDQQVPAKPNLAAYKNALTEEQEELFTFVELPHLNHLFQEATTGSLAEYYEIDESFNEEAMHIILNWILDL